jgi:hypothetical protein
MKKWIVGILMIGLIISCRNKKQDSTTAYFDVVDYIGAQIKQMDTLSLPFIKITIADSTSDTSRISKEEFHRYANEFLSIPNIASSSKRDDYKETSSFDEILGKVLLIYTPEKNGEVVQNETIMSQPQENADAIVETILIRTTTQEGDLSIEKNLTWHIGKRFQIVTKQTGPKLPEKINTVIVTWE